MPAEHRESPGKLSSPDRTSVCAAKGFVLKWPWAQKVSDGCQMHHASWPCHESFPRARKLLKKISGFLNAAFCFAVPWIGSRGSFLNVSWPCHGSKSFQAYCPSSLLERRVGAHGFRADLEARSGLNGSRCAGFTVSGGRFSPPCI